MKSKISRILIGISLLAVLGCNPYAGQFKCGKDTPFGSCGSTPEVYAEIMEGNKPGVSVPEVMLDSCPDCVKDKKRSIPVASQTLESAYQEELLRKAAGLLKQPVTPLVIPPSVICIWFPPMLGESSKVINMEQNVCMFLDDAKFVMGDYLHRSGE